MTGTGELFRYYILVTVLSHCVPPPTSPTPGRVYRHKAMVCLGAILSSLWEPASMTGAAALFPYSGHGIMPTFWSRYSLIALFPHCGHGIKPIFWSRYRLTASFPYSGRGIMPFFWSWYCLTAVPPPPPPPTPQGHGPSRCATVKSL